jgi:hypothetical protein
LMCRRSLEALCRSQGVQSENLDSKLKKLAEQRVIDALSYDAPAFELSAHIGRGEDTVFQEPVNQRQRPLG